MAKPTKIKTLAVFREIPFNQAVTIPDAKKTGRAAVPHRERSGSATAEAADQLMRNIRHFWSRKQAHNCVKIHPSTCFVL
jgi:hypothetical protein